MIQFYQTNYRQPQPTHDRKSYYTLRSQVRSWRRNGIAQMDVAWYAESLGIGPYETWVTRREAYSWIGKRWYRIPRLSAPQHHSCLRVAVQACSGRLP